MNAQPPTPVTTPAEQALPVLPPLVGSQFAAPLTGYAVADTTETAQATGAVGPNQPVTAAPPRRPPPFAAVAKTSGVTAPVQSQPVTAPVNNNQNGAMRPDQAVLSMMRQAVNLQHTQPQVFHLLVLPDDEPVPQLHEYTDIQLLIEQLRDLIGKSCYVFVFLGHRLHVTKGEFRYLVTPLGNFPLFELPTTVPGTCDDGWVGGPIADDSSDTAASEFDLQDVPDAEVADPQLPVTGQPVPPPPVF